MSADFEYIFKVYVCIFWVFYDNFDINFQFY